MKNVLVLLGCTMLAMSFHSTATAQSGTTGSRSSVSALSRARGGLNISPNNRPTVSPYLRLLNNNGNANNGLGASNAVYQTQVRPALERRQNQAQQQQQIQGIQRDLSRLRNQFTRPSSGFMATGHQTRFMTYSHYYPALNRF